MHFLSREAREFALAALVAAALALVACGGDDDSGGGTLATGGTGTGGTGAFATGGSATGGNNVGGTDTGGAGTGGVATGGTGGLGGSTVCVGTVTGTCGDRLCDLMPGCTASAAPVCGGTADPCSSYDGNVTGCDAQWGCGLGANGVCAMYDTTCADYDETYCLDFPGCWWSGLYCNGDIVQSCVAQVTQPTCESNPACFWTAATVQYCGGASIPCASMTSETCEMQVGCTLTPATCSGTPTPCEALSDAQCLLQPGCRLSSGGTRVIQPTGIQTNAPDLAFDTFALRRSGDALWLDIAEVNRGTVDAPVHSNAIILSVNDTYGDSDDYVLFAPDTTFVLPAYGLQLAALNGSLEMPTAAELTPGYYYPIGVLDSGGIVTELEESNNVIVLPAIRVGPDMIDLALVSATHALTGTAAPGDGFDVSLTVHNASTATVATAAVAVYLSADDAHSADDIAASCAGDLALGLAAGAEGDFTLHCTLPRARGTFTLLVELNPTDALGDADRTNNLAVAPGTITIDAPAPDLVVTGLSSSSYAVDWKGTVTLSATVENTGADPGPATSVSFYTNGSDLLCSASVPALAAGGSTVVTRDCTLGDAAVGTLPLRAVVDPNDVIYEASETNNSLDSGTDLVVAQPDVNLVAAGVGIVAGGTSRSAGQTLPVYFEIQNDGTQDAPPYRFIFYASVDTDISPADDIEFCVRDATTGQAAGTTTAGASTDCTVPTMPTGDYYIGMVVDTEGVIPETDEGDNVTVDSVNLLTITP